MPTLMNTYGQPTLTFTHGKGVYLYDENNKQYLDAISGIGVNALGHSHPAVTAAIQNQAEQLLHTSNLYAIKNQQQLADSLCRISGMDNIFFGNSGAEANEAAIKIARLYGHNHGIDQPQIVVMENAFHGRTLATLSATGNRKIQAGFEPLVTGFIRVPFGDLDAIQQITNNKNIAAVLLEPIQGEGGLHCLPNNYLKQLRKLCDKQNWLLMLDEVQTGNGRTGEYFAFLHEDIVPDVVTTAKGLGNGVPIGACLAHGKAAEVFGPGNHGSTYGGNPLVCAAAQAVVDSIETEKLCDNAKTMGSYLREGFAKQLANVSALKDIRGQGLMIGIELDHNCSQLVSDAREQGMLINVTSESVVRLLPPLILNKDEADQIINTVSKVIIDFVG
jgi:acetylornithine aminotransferase